MSFRQHMLGTQSQESVLRMQEAEIHMFDVMASFVTGKAAADRDYACALSALVTKALKHEPAFKTPLFEVWTKLLNQTEQLAQLIRTQADLINTSVCEKFNSLVADRKVARQMFLEEKAIYENELNHAKGEINRNYSEYVKAMMKTKGKKKEFDELNSKGKQVSKLDDIKRKYNTLTDKLHRIHNDYVLSLNDGNTFKDGLVSQLLPQYMAAQQEYCQDSLDQCKQILIEFTKLMIESNQKYTRVHENMNSNVASIIPKQEYQAFIADHKSEVQMDGFSFDKRLFDGYVGILKPDEVAVDENTHDFLNQLRKTSKQRVDELEQQISNYQEQIAAENKELSSPGYEASKSENAPKKRYIKYLERKKEEAILSQKRQRQIMSEIDTALEAVDPSNLPKATTLEINSSSYEPQNGVSPSSSQNSRTPSNIKIKNPFSKLKDKLIGVSVEGEGQSTSSRGKRPSARDEYCVVIPGDGLVIRMTSNPGCPLEDEEWFHGILPRDEVQKLLKSDGDYLVRESKKRNTDESQFVLSVMWQGPKHFIIQTCESGWRLEGQPFPSIQELIINQHKSNSPVTNRSQAILRNPVMRETWQIKNDDIKLEEKIGNGNFGDVFRGKYKGQVVAVKTCKEELQEDQKKKFITEGRILRQYDHPNIVKFVGIAAQKNPVMIVMEFVSGGALLSWLRKYGLSESRKKLVEMCLDAACGMEYLESKNVIHRDLAARNCLISETKAVKISDFGMSREDGEYEVKGGMRQIPIKWTAPEALNYGKYTSLCDVWSFGILMWEIFSAGKTPYPNMKNQEARDRVDQGYRMPIPDNCPNAIYSLMRDCWEEKPERRPQFNKIVPELKEILREAR